MLYKWGVHTIRIANIAYTKEVTTFSVIDINMT